jgi:hypothetical protein
VDLTKSYAREPLTNDDLPRILADAKTNPELEKAVHRGGVNGGIRVDLGKKWAIDRASDSYLFWFDELSYSKIQRDGYMFFFQGKAFSVFLHTTNYVHGSRQRYVPKGMVGWVSLTKDFSTPPPQDPDFQRAFSEAYSVLNGRFRPKPVFSIEQQDKELAT